jgi:hypothetical protein
VPPQPEQLDVVEPLQDRVVRAAGDVITTSTMTSRASGGEPVTSVDRATTQTLIINDRRPVSAKRRDRGVVVGCIRCSW